MSSHETEEGFGNPLDKHYSFLTECAQNIILKSRKRGGIESRIYTDERLKRYVSAAKMFAEKEGFSARLSNLAQIAAAFDEAFPCWIKTKYNSTQGLFIDVIHTKKQGVVAAKNWMEICTQFNSEERIFSDEDILLVAKAILFEFINRKYEGEDFSRVARVLVKAKDLLEKQAETKKEERGSN